MATNQPAVVMVKSGTVNARKFYGLTATNTYKEIVGAVEQLSVVTNGTDTLACNPFKADGVTIDSSITVTVMKPWTLRRTPFDGKTVNSISYTYTDNATRTATGSTTETQKITQDYFAGAVIYAQVMQD